MRKIIPIIILLVAIFTYFNWPKSELKIHNLIPSPSPKVSLKIPPSTKVLQNDYHVFQTFNNCGPAALSMALSYYGVKESQETLGRALRPYQVPGGVNDDKSVTLEELAEYSEYYDLIPYHRPNGNIDLIERFITYDIPVITRTYLKEGEDIGHYRVVKGYTESEIIQDDSLQGKNLRYSLNDFNSLWEDFNFEYLVLIPKEKQKIAEVILGEDLDLKKSWQKALRLTQNQLEANPKDTVDRFNLSVAYHNIGEYQKSIEEFEKVENKLSFRTLWYQIEPIESYYELGNYQKVFQITDKILNNHNRAFAELYILRGKIYQKQGNIEAAKSEFEKAILYNKYLGEAQGALESL